MALAFVCRALLAGAHPAPDDDPAAELRRAYFRVYPDQALGRGGTQESVTLAPLGVGWLDWRTTLRSTLRRLERSANSERPGLAQARRRAMASWVESELLRWESLSTARTDPSAYVEHALRLFQAIRETPGVAPAQRETVWMACLGQLPAFLADARVQLVNPNPVAIDQALTDLTAFEGLLSRPREVPLTADGEDPRAAIPRFRRWLLETRLRVAGEPRRMGADWARYVQLATGTRLEPRAIKALLLRELAGSRAPQPQAAGLRVLETIPTTTLERGFVSASTRALALAQLLEVVGPGPDPERLVLEIAESPEHETRTVVDGWGNAREERLKILLPSVAWSADRSAERLAEFFPRPLVALGLRFGMVGETLFARAVREAPRPFTSAVLRRPLMEGFGLFALDWVPRLQHEDSPFLADPDLARAIEAQQALEAARLLAALELHAEGLSFDEALVGFLRRTELDPERARAEVTRALMDPAHGLGALARHELRELESRMERLLGPAKALPRLIRLVLENPELRPGDLPDAL